MFSRAEAEYAYLAALSNHRVRTESPAWKTRSGNLGDRCCNPLAATATPSSCSSGKHRLRSPAAHNCIPYTAHPGRCADAKFFPDRIPIWTMMEAGRLREICLEQVADVLSPGRDSLAFPPISCASRRFSKLALLPDATENRGACAAWSAVSQPTVADGLGRIHRLLHGRRGVRRSVPASPASSPASTPKDGAIVKTGDLLATD
mgnify:CR=1 FL=1